MPAMHTASTINFHPVRELMICRLSFGRIFWRVCLKASKSSNKPHFKYFLKRNLSSGHGFEAKSTFILTPVTNHNGKHTAQVSLSYDKDQCLWIVGATQENLISSQSYSDLWNHVQSEEIPNYQQSSDNSQIKTSIILPVYSEYDNEHRKFGVINFESIQYLEISNDLQTEFRLIADNIAKLYFRHQSFLEQNQDTRRAIQELLKFRDIEELGFTEPSRRIFFAYPSRGDQEVIGEIIQLLGNIDNYELIEWNQITNTGIINTQILETIRECSYGICYFSEEIDTENGIRYQDNSNVLIEAGMLSMLSVLKGQFDNWIPIRENSEKCVEEIPFDFRPLRILTVPRTKNNALNRSSFAHKLQERIETMTNTSDD